jgi:protein-S-isoprenylcysteine O-methyltransferase Ste14
MVRRTLVLAYAILAYLSFFAAILYAIAFEANTFVPKGIDDGLQPTSWATAVGINVALLLLFAVQHTIMARGGFKRWLVRFVPHPVERSTFVLASSLLLLLIFWQWRPMDGTIWTVINPFWKGVLVAVSLAGWAMVFYSSFLIDHFELFGLRQSWLYFRGRPYTPPHFVKRSFYNYVRHPLMLGFLIAFWVTPVMTLGHLLFSLVITAYVVFGVTVEERDLLRAHGEAYEQYRRSTPMLIPFLRFSWGGDRRRVAGEIVRQE